MYNIIKYIFFKDEKTKMNLFLYDNVSVDLIVYDDIYEIDKFIFKFKKENYEVSLKKIFSLQKPYLENKNIKNYIEPSIQRNNNNILLLIEDLKEKSLLVYQYLIENTNLSHNIEYNIINDLRKNIQDNQKNFNFKNLIIKKNQSCFNELFDLF